MTNEPPPDEAATGTPEPPETPVIPLPPSGPRRLTRSRDQRVLGGVAGGLGEYLGVDAVLVRIAWVILILAGFGLGLIVYVVAWIIIPEAEPGDAAVRAPRTHGDAGVAAAVIFGVILIAVGAVALLRAIDVQGPSLQLILVAILALVGVGLIAQARRGLSGGLVALGVVITLILTAMGGVDLDFDIDSDSAFGSRSLQPANFDDLDRSYDHAFGSVDLDLRRLDPDELPRGTTTIKMEVAFGSIEIRVGDIPLRIEGDAVFGSCDDRSYNDYDSAVRRLLIDASAAFGSCEAR
jgi:phage shock protein PspC (stress-responsive transcriptional regulator)